eukprot:jgi/Ulvmu1/5544/UM023_0080.1
MRIGKGIRTVLFTAVTIIPTLIQYALLCIFCRSWFKNVRTKRVSDEGIQHPPVDGVHHEFILCKDVRIHVARAGMDATKKLVMFLHGFPEFWYSWRAQIEDLQEDYELAALDLPGFNASDKPKKITDYLTQNVCQIIAAALDGLCRDSCILVGHDWGGAVANDFAAMYPARVEKLVLLSVPPSPLFMDNMDLHQLSRSIYLWQLLVPGVIEKLVPVQDWAIVRLMFTEESWGGLVQRDLSDEDIEHYKDAIAVQGAIKASLSYHRAALWHSSVLVMNTEVDAGYKLNPRLQMPLLVLVGDADTAVTLNLLRRVGRVAAKATVRVVPDCSHWVQQDAPEEVSRLLRAFIECEADVL